VKTAEYGGKLREMSVVQVHPSPPSNQQVNSAGKSMLSEKGRFSSVSVRVKNKKLAIDGLYLLQPNAPDSNHLCSSYRCHEPRLRFVCGFLRTDDQSRVS
jgi:hypothetical protein